MPSIFVPQVTGFMWNPFLEGPLCVPEVCQALHLITIILKSNFFISQDDIEPYFEAYHCLGEMMEKSQYKASNRAQASLIPRPSSKEERRVWRI